MEQWYILDNWQKNSFYNTETWTQDNPDIITKTSIHTVILTTEMKKYLSGSNAFLMTFNLSKLGNSYCTQIAFDYFDFKLIKRNGYPKNGNIIWNNWDAVK